MTYNILINDDQRRALIYIITKTGYDNEGSPLEHWLDILADLPKDEAENPGFLHGLCL
jgi:hypothetical protein